MNFDDAIDELNKYLEDDAKAIVNYISNYKSNLPPSPINIKLNAFDEIIFFNRDPIKGTPENKLLSSKKGIYVFIMTTNYQRTSKFNHVYYGAPLRDLTITTFSSGVILYLGTAKSILTRMHQHFATDNDYNRTGSLKLGSINRQSLLGSFMIYAFCIKDKYAKYYPLIGPTVEKYLHNNLSVLVGNN